MTAWLAEDGFEDPSRYTADVHAWATRLMGDALRGDLEWHEDSLPPWWSEMWVDPDRADEMTAVLLETPEKYLRWVPYEEYQGDHYAAGRWCVQWKRVARDLRDVQLAIDAQRTRTLDEWLRADMAGTLVHIGAVGGSAKLHLDVQERLHKEAEDREWRLSIRGIGVRKWRRLIRADLASEQRRCRCGTTFTPTRTNAVRCPPCLELARDRRRRRAEDAQ